MEALHDADRPVRLAAAAALWATGQDAKQTIPALITMLADEDHLGRASAAEALGDVAPDAKQLRAPKPTDPTRQASDNTVLAWASTCGLTVQTADAG